MNALLSQCPVCGDELLVTRLHCRQCDTTIEGRFVAGPLSGLTPEQLVFVETFVRCEGKFTRMEDELGLSYPTIRSRLYDVIRALGFEPGGEGPAGISDEERREVLKRLEDGAITADEAIGLFEGDEGEE